MKQFFVLSLLCFCFFSLADHDDTIGFDHNGRRFACQNFNRTKHFAEVYTEDQKHLYAFGLCQLHRGHRDPGIETLKKAADKGSYMAAIIVSKYYLSDKYDFSQESGRTTGTESNLLESINYMERAVAIIRDKPNYPFGDPKDLDVESKIGIYLTTLNDLVNSYMNLFAIRIVEHRESTNMEADNGTIEALNKTAEVADICLSIPFNEQVWDKEIFDKRMAICRKNKVTSEELLLMEKLRLIASRDESCKDKRLLMCDIHVVAEQPIRTLYRKYTGEIGRLILFFRSLRLIDN